MKGNYKFGIGLLVVVIIAIALIQAGQKEPVNWARTYNPKDKIPFGTYIVRHELKNIFTENKAVNDIQQSVYTYLNDSAKGKKNLDFLFIGSAFHPGEASLKSLLTFADRGNNVFISALNIPKELLDTLKLSTRAFSAYEAKVPYTKDSVYYELAGSDIAARFDKNGVQFFFDKLDSGAVTILGYLRRENLRLPDFIRVQYGKGSIYLQLTPDVYSNYFMLNPETFPVAFASLRHLNGDNILWYDGHFMEDRIGTPLRFILSQPTLRAAWYLLLFTLLLFLIFKSRREQAAIPIVKPEENLSVSFAETIGSLYYENGHPGNMIHKKINYFLYALKKQFRFDITDITQPAFRKQAHLKLKLPAAEIDIFFDHLNYYQSLDQPTISDLKSVQVLIEDFKQKIKLS